MAKRKKVTKVKTARQTKLDTLDALLNIQGSLFDLDRSVTAHDDIYPGLRLQEAYETMDSAIVEYAKEVYNLRKVSDDDA